MKRPVVYATEGPWAQIAPYFAEGAGVECTPIDAGIQDGCGIIWGLLRGSPEMIGEHMLRGQPFVYLDHGYFKRGHYSGHYRCTLNDFQQREVIERPDDRWRSLNVEMKPWRQGREIVICPPSDHQCNVFGWNGWLEGVFKALHSATDRTIRVRLKNDPHPFIDAIKTAHCVVTLNSIAAVEAVLEGVPVFVDPISAASPVGQTDLTMIESPVYPDREKWAHSLAYGQFTRVEMKEGLAWKTLAERL